MYVSDYLRDKHTFCKGRYEEREGVRGIVGERKIERNTHFVKGERRKESE